MNQIQNTLKVLIVLTVILSCVAVGSVASSTATPSTAISSTTADFDSDYYGYDDLNGGDCNYDDDYYGDDYDDGYIDPNIPVDPSDYPNDYFEDNPYNGNAPLPTPDSKLVNGYYVNLPSYYDLRDYNRVSPMRNQGKHGTCWTFATLTSLESSLLTQDPTNYTGIDLSEHHLAYFANHRESISDIENPLAEIAGLRGDFGYWVPQSDYMKNGGNSYTSMYTLMSWIGAADDTTAPYPAKGETVFALDDSLAVASDVVHVQNVSLVSLVERNAIKTMLMEHGAAHISFRQDNSKKNRLSFSDNTIAYYYTGDKTTTNHAVTLIGWDDTFSRYDFATTPEGDGAWLLQNSYGDDSKASYIWISYYDPIMKKPSKSVAFFEADPTFAYDNNYQYDGSLYSTNYNIKKSSASFANVFEAKGYEYLKAVAFETQDPDLRYSIQIYRNPNSDDPTSGTPMLETPVTGVMQYEGYHTVPLTDLQNPSSRLRLVAGNKFAVVVTLSDDHDGIVLSFEGPKENNPYSRPYVLAGQSYYTSSNGNWVDTSIWNKEELKVGNARIKAYTSNAAEGETWPDPAESPVPVLGIISGLFAVAALSTGRVVRGRK